MDGSSSPAAANHQEGSERELLPPVPMRVFLDEPETFTWKDKTKHTVFGLDDRLPFELLELMGYSKNAAVHKADCRKELGYSRILAVKVIKCDDKKTARDVALEEPKIMEGLRHPHIVAFVGSYIWEYEIGIFMYPAARWNLWEYMREIPGALSGTDGHTLVPDPLQRINHLRSYFVCLSQALRYLHHSYPTPGKPTPIKHKDIKPKNILVDEFNSPILTDFDISHIYEDVSKSETGGETRFTHQYASPETARSKRRGLKSDVFSLGCVFLEIASIILGKSLDELYIHVRDDVNSHYYRNLDKVKTWVHYLSSSVPTSNSRPLDHASAFQTAAISSSRLQDPMLSALPSILKMLSSQDTHRPKADALATRFQHVSKIVCPDCDPRSTTRHRSIPEETHEPALIISTGSQFLEVADQDQSEASSTGGEPSSAESPNGLFPDKSNSRSVHGRLVERTPTLESLPIIQGRRATPPWRGRRRKVVIVYFHEVQKLFLAYEEGLEAIEKTRVSIARFSKVVELKIGSDKVVDVDLTQLNRGTFLKCYFGLVKSVFVLGKTGES